MAMGTQIRMYEKRGDEYPRCRVELPILSLPAVEAFTRRYSIPQVQLSVGYMDFTREISKNDLKTWIQGGYISKLDPELKSWLDEEVKYDVVDVLCYEWYYDQVIDKK